MFRIKKHTTMNTRPQSNAAAIQRRRNPVAKRPKLERKIQHYRRVPVLEVDGNKWEKQIVPDFEWRKFLFTGYYDLPDENGGATELILKKGEEKIVVRADCYAKDRFARRLGVREALKKLENLYGIKP